LSLNRRIRYFLLLWDSHWWHPRGIYR